ncbi:DUF2339 domain-containing protein [Rheinheimera sp. WS51]|uniref:DUF2339 domain-containing protein n=1 Tax=Rheinheimera sp. WS51 TaxID=3425886 RepID=UPI003D8DCFE6
METIVLVIVLLSLAIVIGGILGWVAFFKVNALSEAYQQLSADFNKLKQQVTEQTASLQSSDSLSSSNIATSNISTRNQSSSNLSTSNLSTSNKTQLSSSQLNAPHLAKAALEPQQQAVPAKPLVAPSSTARPKQPVVKAKPKWLVSIIDNWMIWLGGISVGLAGIFMVKHSINMGLLGPKTQISLAIISGVLLHIIANGLRRRNGKSDPVFASLAGGASITLYAALLAGLHMYQLITPGWAFALLALVSLATMALSLVHGPLLAILGLIAAYVVPLFVSSSSGNIVSALIYVLIISGSALILLRFVFRPWLWWSIIIGTMGWWLISILAYDADSFRAIYLALFAWALLALPHFDWLLQAKSKNLLKALDAKNIQIHQYSFSLNQIALSVVILGWAVSLFVLGYKPWHVESMTSFITWAPLVAVLMLASTKRQSFWALPWLSLILHIAAWIAMVLKSNLTGYQFQPLAADLQQSFLYYASLMSLLFSALSAWQWRFYGFSHPRVSLTLLTPLIWLALAYVYIDGLSQSLHWSFFALSFAFIYAAVAAWRLHKNPKDNIALWLTLATHFAYSLAAVIYLREALLSLVIAAQLLSLAYLIRRYQLAWLEILLKAMVAIVVLRLTFNPWLADYPTDVHWSLYTYGGATLFAFLASRQLSANNEKAQLKVWLEAASLHLLVLTIGTELRYWLYQGDIFSSQYHLVESAINSSLWAALGLTYYYRASLSKSLKGFYLLSAKLLLGLAAASYFISLSYNNPWFSGELVSSTALFNILLLAYGAPIIWALLVAYYYDPRYKKLALQLAGLASFIFITIEIRQLWQGSDLSLNNATSDGEVYTYSVIWMLMSIPAVLFGARKKIQQLYKVGLVLLLVVIGKIFLIDMAGLDGLWRVASFMGLGLTLLALAWFYKRIKAETEA